METSAPRTLGGEHAAYCGAVFHERKPAMTTAPHSSADYIDLEHRYAAHNYSPLDVVIARGEGAWVEDVEGCLLYTSRCV